MYELYHGWELRFWWLKIEKCIPKTIYTMITLTPNILKNLIRRLLSS